MQQSTVVCFPAFKGHGCLVAAATFARSRISTCRIGASGHLSWPSHESLRTWITENLQSRTLDHTCLGLGVCLQSAESTSHQCRDIHHCLERVEWNSLHANPKLLSNSQCLDGSCSSVLCVCVHVRVNASFHLNVLISKNSRAYLTISKRIIEQNIECWKPSHKALRFSFSRFPWSFKSKLGPFGTSSNWFQDLPTCPKRAAMDVSLLPRLPDHSFFWPPFGNKSRPKCHVAWRAMQLRIQSPKKDSYTIPTSETKQHQVTSSVHRIHSWCRPLVVTSSGGFTKFCEKFFRIPPWVVLYVVLCGHCIFCELVLALRFQIMHGNMTRTHC